MWVRKITKQGNVEGVSLPAEAMKALGWEKGNYLIVRMPRGNAILLTKFNPASLSDRQLHALKETRTIYA